MRVWKFPLAPGDNTVEMPEGSELLEVVLTHEGPALLALVDPDLDAVERTFYVAENGEELPEGIGSLHYRGTAKLPGAFTANVFETTEVAAAA